MKRTTITEDDRGRSMFTTDGTDASLTMSMSAWQGVKSGIALTALSLRALASRHRSITFEMRSDR